MDELVKMVAQKVGLSADQAKQAVEVVMGFLKDKLPGDVFGQLGGVLGGITGVAGKAAGAAADTAKDAAEGAGEAAEGILESAKDALGNLLGRKK